MDYTPYICVANAIDYLASLDGGFSATQNGNRQLAMYGRNLIMQNLDAVAYGPENMLGSMATLCLPPELNLGPADPKTNQDPLAEILAQEFHIEVPVHSIPGMPHKLLRLSAFIYNDENDFELLAHAMEKIRNQNNCQVVRPIKRYSTFSAFKKAKSFK
jgi:isopenicillin-N epimerase